MDFLDCVKWSAEPQGGAAKQGHEVLAHDEQHKERINIENMGTPSSNRDALAKHSLLRFRFIVLISLPLEL